MCLRVRLHCVTCVATVCLFVGTHREQWPHCCSSTASNTIKGGSRCEAIGHVKWVLVDSAETCTHTHSKPRTRGGLNPASPLPRSIPSSLTLVTRPPTTHTNTHAQIGGCLTHKHQRQQQQPEAVRQALLS